jgi:hypothetical protein
LRRPHQEEQFECDAIAQFKLRLDDPDDVLGGEELALDVAEARRADWDDRVTVQLELGLRPFEERHEDGAHFLARPRRRFAPALVDEITEARRAGGRLEIHELEVGMVDRELGEDRLVVAQRLGGRAVLVPEPSDEVRDLETDRSRPVGLVLHSFSHDPGRIAERQADHLRRRRIRST